jgi:hypothetical protein
MPKLPGLTAIHARSDDSWTQHTGRSKAWGCRGPATTLYEPPDSRKNSSACGHQPRITDMCMYVYIYARCRVMCLAWCSDPEHDCIVDCVKKHSAPHQRMYMHCCTAGMAPQQQACMHLTSGGRKKLRCYASDMTAGDSELGMGRGCCSICPQPGSLPAHWQCCGKPACVCQVCAVHWPPPNCHATVMQLVNSITPSPHSSRMSDPPWPTCLMQRASGSREARPQQANMAPAAGIMGALCGHSTPA